MADASVLLNSSSPAGKLLLEARRGIVLRRLLRRGVDGLLLACLWLVPALLVAPVLQLKAAYMLPPAALLLAVSILRRRLRPTVAETALLADQALGLRERLSSLLAGSSSRLREAQLMETLPHLVDVAPAQVTGPLWPHRVRLLPAACAAVSVAFLTGASLAPEAASASAGRAGPRRLVAIPLPHGLDATAAPELSVPLAALPPAPVLPEQERPDPAELDAGPADASRGDGQPPDASQGEGERAGDGAGEGNSGIGRGGMGTLPDDLPVRWSTLENASLPSPQRDPERTRAALDLWAQRQVPAEHAAGVQVYLQELSEISLP